MESDFQKFLVCFSNVHIGYSPTRIFEGEGVWWSEDRTFMCIMSVLDCFPHIVDRHQWKFCWGFLFVLIIAVRNNISLKLHQVQETCKGRTGGCFQVCKHHKQGQERQENKTRRFNRLGENQWGSAICRLQPHGHLGTSHGPPAGVPDVP